MMEPNAPPLLTSSGKEQEGMRDISHCVTEEEEEGDEENKKYISQEQQQHWDDDDENDRRQGNKSRSGSNNSLRNTNDGSASPENSRREQIRAKLRKSEARLLQYTRGAAGANSHEEDETSSPGGGGRNAGGTTTAEVGGHGGVGLLGQMIANTADYVKKVEAEKSVLELELEKLHQKTEMDEGLRAHMATIQEGFQKQVDQIISLQETVAVKDDEIFLLKQELVQKLRRIVELEFDLETHSIHFTNYAKEQFQLGEDALNELTEKRRPSHNSISSAMNSSADDASYISSAANDHTRRGAQRKAQKLISKLLSDLDDLEARYKVDRLDAASELHHAQMTIDQLSTKLQVLETQLSEQNNATANTSKNNNHNKDDTDTSSTLATSAFPNTRNSNDSNNTIVEELTTASTNVTLQVLRRRNQTLEARTKLSQQEMFKLRSIIKEKEQQILEFQAQYRTAMEQVQFANAQVKDLQAVVAATSSSTMTSTSPSTSPNTRRTTKSSSSSSISSLPHSFDKKQKSGRRSFLKKMTSRGRNKLLSSSCHSACSSISGGHVTALEEQAPPMYNIGGGDDYGNRVDPSNDNMKRILEKMAYLEAEQIIKDRQISALKKEVTTLRVKHITQQQPPQGHPGTQGFSERDVTLLRTMTNPTTAATSSFTAANTPRNNIVNVDMNKEKHDHETRTEKHREQQHQEEKESSSSDSYVLDLQAQLQETKQQLMNKDQELVMERAKSATTTAGLLARITSTTTAQQPTSKQQIQEQRPPSPIQNDPGSYFF